MIMNFNKILLKIFLCSASNKFHGFKDLNCEWTISLNDNSRPL